MSSETICICSDFCGCVDCVKLRNCDNAGIIGGDDGGDSSREGCRRCLSGLGFGGILIVPVVAVGRGSWSRCRARRRWCLVERCRCFGGVRWLRSRGRVIDSRTAIGRSTCAESHSDSGVLTARLHAIRIIGSVAVCLLLRAAIGTIGGDLPIIIPWVTIDTAQVVPNDTIVVKRVLVLQDVIQVVRLGKLDGPTIAIRQFSPGLRPGLARSKSFVLFFVATAAGWNIAELDWVAALVLHVCQRPGQW